MKPKYKIHDLVGTADLRRTLSKWDTTKWFHKLYEITEIKNDTIPIEVIDQLHGRYNEAFLKKTELTLKEIKDIMKALNLN